MPSETADRSGEKAPAKSRLQVWRGVQQAPEVLLRTGTAVLHGGALFLRRSVVGTLVCAGRRKPSAPVGVITSRHKKELRNALASAGSREPIFFRLFGNRVLETAFVLRTGLSPPNPSPSEVRPFEPRCQQHRGSLHLRLRLLGHPPSQAYGPKARGAQGKIVEDLTGGVSTKKEPRAVYALGVAYTSCLRLRISQPTIARLFLFPGGKDLGESTVTRWALLHCENGAAAIRVDDRYIEPRALFEELLVVPRVGVICGKSYNEKPVHHLDR